MAEGYTFDETSANNVRKFFESFLRHGKGQWASQPFVLQDWQYRDVIAPLFGWKRPDGTRRYRVAYIEIPKKNGKSTICAGIALFLLVADKEIGAEVYSAAADRSQASIVFNEAGSMVNASTMLRSKLEVIPSTKRIVYRDKGSVYSALSADVKTKEGLNIHGLIFDELHAQPNRKMWDTLRYGGRARRQPLTVAITTAGFDRTSICWEQHEYARQILDGTIYDPGFYAYIRSADLDDDWTKPETWRKANPSLGTIIKEDDLAADCKEAQTSTVKENTFKRYSLNIWTEQQNRWLRMEDWNKCAELVRDAGEWRRSQTIRLAGRDCYAGLDLGSTSDITACVLVFPEDDGYTLIPHFWVPKDSVGRKDKAHEDLYQAWLRDGWLTGTLGNVCDYNRVVSDIGLLSKAFRIREIAVDRLFQGAQVCTDLQEKHGMTVIAFGQGFLSMAAPSKRFEEEVIAGRMHHGNNPILKWMAANVEAKTDEAGNVKPVKPGGPFKIDGIVATIMGIGRAMFQPVAKRSKYEDAELVAL